MVNMTFENLRKNINTRNKAIEKPGSKETFVLSQKNRWIIGCKN